MSGYVMLPGWLLALKPSANAILIYATLATYGTFNTALGVYEECRPSIASIAADSGTSDSTVKRALAELLELRAIERTERWAEDGKTRLPSVYRVVFGAISGPSGVTGEPTPPSTGEPTLGSPVTRNQEPSTQNQNTKKPSASPRGTRLPKDWLPSDELKAWARDNAPGVGWNEHARFVDYWIAQPGMKGSKVDWEATWRNWMRKAAEDVRPVSGAPRTFKQMDRDDAAHEQRIAQAMDLVMEQDQSLSFAAARKVVLELIEQNHLDLNALKTSTPTGYIEAEMIADQVQEVTGS